MDHESKTTHDCETLVVQEGTVETQDRGLFDFMGKKEEEGEKKQEEVMVELMVEKSTFPSSIGASQSLARKEEEDGEKKQEEVMVEKFTLPTSVSAQSLAQKKKDEEGILSSIGAAQSPAPATSRDVMAIDQGVAYLLMLVALVVTYIIH